MVMADRPDVPTASLPGTALAVGALATRLATTLATLPLHRPWRGPDDLLTNTAQEGTREVLRSFLVGALALPTPELRSVEKLLDDLCRAVLPPLAARGLTIEDGTVGGVPGMWVRDGARPRGTILYLHGGGYLATTPFMYTAVTAELVRRTGCEVFVADYRLAPEFPFPAALHDAISVFEGLLGSGVPAGRLVVAGDSGGGGLATSLLEDARREHLPAPAAAVLLSPEVDLAMGEPSVAANARRDVLPPRIPIRGYLGDDSPTDPMVSAVYADVGRYPPTFVAYGTDEMFRDEIEELVAHLRDRGVPVESLAAPHTYHVYEILMPWATVSRATFDAIASFVDPLLV
ncbi:MAG: alpha/beta hydrolase [Actinobacteria bacterium]|nr:alpha/beta hydrolase [Actinomycetota bacterium]